MRIARCTVNVPQWPIPLGVNVKATTDDGDTATGPVVGILAGERCQCGTTHSFVVEVATDRGLTGWQPIYRPSLS